MKVSKHEVSKPYFPGFTRKSVTFSIDDGNLVLDKKFISIVAPYGIKGTFNLCGNNIISSRLIFAGGSSKGQSASVRTITRRVFICYKNS